MIPILVINSGSSSLKFGLFVERAGDEQPLLSGSAQGIGGHEGRIEILDKDRRTLHEEEGLFASQKEALTHITEKLATLAKQPPQAIGHRVVHGGPKLVIHQRITPEVLETLEADVHFAPLHIPALLALIRHTQELFPGLPEFACFDTAFHQTLPESAYRYALPERFYEQGVRRYGFHGLSYESIVHRLGGELPSRAVAAHLGSGSSVTALRDGKSNDTSMGLTPTGGIPMGTRPGDLDPGVVLYLMRTAGISIDELEQLLNRQSGMAALSGGSSDMRELEAAIAHGDAKAQLAIEIFCQSIARTAAAYAVILGGLDMLIFTGGIGEHSVHTRALVCEKLALLGVELDQRANENASLSISSATSRCRVSIIPAEEERQIARHCRKLLHPA